MRLRTLTWALAGLLGMLVTVAITWEASRLASERIGLASEPLAITRQLAPRVLAHGRVAAKPPHAHKVLRHRPTKAKTAVAGIAPSAPTAVSHGQPRHHHHHDSTGHHLGSSTGSDGEGQAPPAATQTVGATNPQTTASAPPSQTAGGGATGSASTTGSSGSTATGSTATTGSTGRTDDGGSDDRGGDDGSGATGSSGTTGQPDD